MANNFEDGLHIERLQAKLVDYRKSHDNLLRDNTRLHAVIAETTAAAKKAILSMETNLQTLDTKLMRAQKLVVKLLRNQGYTDEQIVAFSNTEENKGIFQLRLAEQDSEDLK